MLGLFKSKPLLSDDDKAFQLETFKWLLKHFGGDDFYKITQLVLPTREHFPLSLENPDDVAAKTFKMVKAHAGLNTWPCELVKQEEDVDPVVAPTMTIQNVPSTPLGTFALEHNSKIVISYNPAITNNPIQLVATFAHELGHYLTGTSACLTTCKAI
jgi:hypothetical protein